MQMFSSRAEVEWTDPSGNYQPYIYVRKDVLYDDWADDDWSGEIWTYDSQYIRLSREGWPWRKWPDPELSDWDPQYDRFLLYLTKGTEAPYEEDDPRVGCEMAKRYFDPTATFDIQNVFSRLSKTYRFQNYDQLSYDDWKWHGEDSAPAPFLYTQVLAPFNTEFDGVCVPALVNGVPATWPASTEFKTFDRAVTLVRQSADGYERFIFARRDGTYYGQVRWDAGRFDGTQNWVEVRTIGLTQGTGAGNDGTRKRVREDNYLWQAPAGTCQIMTVDNDGVVFGAHVAGSAVTGTSRLGHPHHAYTPDDPETHEDDWLSLWGWALTSEQQSDKPIGIGNVNNYGGLDFVAVNSGGQIVAALVNNNQIDAPDILGSITGFTSQDTSIYRPMGIANVDANPCADVVLINNSGQVKAWLVAAVGTDLQFTTTVQYLGKPFTNWGQRKPIGTADFDGNGRDDFFLVNETGLISVLLVNTQGTGRIDYVWNLGNPHQSWGWSFTSAQTAELPIGIADVDGNGRPDVLIARGSNIWAVLISNTTPPTITGSINLVSLSTQGRIRLRSDTVMDKPLGISFGWGWWPNW